MVTMAPASSASATAGRFAREQCCLLVRGHDRVYRPLYFVHGGWRVGHLRREPVRVWIEQLDDVAHARVVQAIDALAEGGPGLGRPLVDTITGSAIQNLKELRPGTVRILFVFDPWRSCILLVAGDKARRWAVWYDEAIPLAEQRYQSYLKAHQEEEEEEEGKS